MRYIRIIDTKVWIENCINCHVPMLLVNRDMNDTLIAIKDSIRYRPLPDTDIFEAWYNLEQPRVEGVNELWHCTECNGMWAVYFGLMMKVDVYRELDGVLMEHMEIDPAYIPESEIIHPFVPDNISNKPSEDATMCPHCHRWRDILSTNVLVLNGVKYEDKRHSCKQCGATEVYRTEQKLFPDQTYIRKDIDPEDLVGSGKEIDIDAIMKDVLE
jgi:hypothetical protein